MRNIVLEGPIGPEIKVWGKEYLFFGGTDYLNMAGRPEVIEAAGAALSRYGLSTAGSRSSTGTNELHLELEAAASRFAASEDSVVLSTGYMSMAALLAAVSSGHDLVLVEKNAHPSIREAVKASSLKSLEYSIDDLDGLEKLIQNPSHSEKKKILVGEGVSPLIFTVDPLPEVLELVGDYNCIVLLDDAHGFGVLGERGRGIAEYHLCQGPQVLTCATLSKAFGSYGGVVPGSRGLCERVRERSMAYNCSTPLPAPVVGAAIAAFRYIEKNSDIIARLRENAGFLKQGLAKINLPAENPTVPIAPIVLDSRESMEQLTERLLKKGIIAPHLHYPGSPEGGIIRLAVTAAHTKKQIQCLLDGLEKFL